MSDKPEHTTYLPFHPGIFDEMSSDEKEALFIWLNKENLPQA